MAIDLSFFVLRIRKTRNERQYSDMIVAHPVSGDIVSQGLCRVTIITYVSPVDHILNTDYADDVPRFITSTVAFTVFLS